MVLPFDSVIVPDPAYVEQKEAPDDDIHGAHEITIRPEIQPEIEARTTFLMPKIYRSFAIRDVAGS